MWFGNGLHYYYEITTNFYGKDAFLIKNWAL